MEHVAQAIIHRIHDVFPPSAEDETDPTSVKKLCKGKGTFAILKCLLGFEFDGINKTIWLEATKRASILTIFHQWIRGSVRAKRGIPFAEFESVVSKLRHAFTALREGRGLLSPCNWIIQCQPQVVYLHRDGALMEALQDIGTILRASTISPTQCKNLVAALPGYIGIVDASNHGIGGGHNRGTFGTPTNGIPFSMATRNISRHCVLHKPKRQDHKLRPGDSWTPPPVAMHGRDCPRFSTQTHRAVQQQFACSELGHKNGVKEILCSCTAGPSTSTPTQHRTVVPPHSGAHPWR